jgi:DNA-binding NarL/FixJ family response regulator
LGVELRILIANERPEVRRLLRNFVEKDTLWEICGEAVDGSDAVHKAHELVPELIILGFGMPVLNGIEAAREIIKFLPQAKMLLCATRLTPLQREQALDAGIRGIVPKTRLGAIRQAIEALLRHETFFAGRSARPTPGIRVTHDRLPALVSEAAAPLQAFVVSDKVFFCEAVKEGLPPTSTTLLLDSDTLVCPRCEQSYTLHYSSLARPVTVQLSRMLTTDLVDSEHPRHSTRLTLELTPSNAVN